ncbi:MAG: aminotransferase class I/II-fold pyridoxal phosphate-dependent enzyme [Ilumatobacter sp.]|nr:aminotransferase class I/II-fold pyridoxal phosphate-dependent enzyme [Ilumatobacter sp.]
MKWSHYGDDVLAAWVADMDYDPPPAVTAALRGHLERGDLGYGLMAADLPDAYAAFQQRHHGWTPDPERVRVFTSALHGLEAAIWNTTEPGDGVVVFTPVYYPFLDAIRDSGRRLVDAPLDPDGWRIDADRLDAAIDPTTRIILFCNPHNPTGRVFDADEVNAVADVAERHDLLVITDEIWGELTHGPLHRPLATCDERFAGRLVTLGSASKSFNLAGLRCAVAHVDHSPLERTLDSMSGHLQGAPSTLGVVGTLTAWTACDDWLAAVRTELTARRDQLARRLAAEAPTVGFVAPEATYLGWLDFRTTGLGDDPARALLKQGGVALSQGPKFGTGGPGFARVNFATTEEILDHVIDRIVETVAAADTVT